LAALSESLTSPGVNVLAETFFTASSASFDKNSLAASILSYESTKFIQFSLWGF
jgi:hypothetical protein